MVQLTSKIHRCYTDCCPGIVQSRSEIQNSVASRTGIQEWGGTHRDRVHCSPHQRKRPAPHSCHLRTVARTSTGRTGSGELSGHPRRRRRCRHVDMTFNSMRSRDGVKVINSGSSCDVTYDPDEQRFELQSSPVQSS